MPERKAGSELPGRAAYARGTRSWIDGLTPPDALALSVADVVEILSERSGRDVDACLAAWRSGAEPSSRPRLDLRGHTTTPNVPAKPGAQPESGTTPGWIARSRMIGINVRTVGSFWRVVHYLLTVPAVYDSVHLLPVWEPGVVGSLYGIASWEINPEFVDDELAERYPNLATAEAQLGLLVELIHATGRRVGLDVIPHTDRYSQIVLAQPHCFEWLRRRRLEIIDHRADLHEEVMDVIHQFVVERGPAATADEPKARTGGATTSAGAIPDRTHFFGERVGEAARNEMLFGARDDYRGRLARRKELVDRLYALGYEPVPATMAPPYRGLRVDANQSYVDADGRTWYDYEIEKPEEMSRVFGPLTRYKFYDRLDDNREWRIDFERPRRAVFDYFASHIRDLVRRFDFDFMRGDMSHVQMRDEGVPLEIDEFYDPLAYVKSVVVRERPSFAYFAETFLAPPGVMAYGDEVDHLEGSAAEVTLGNLQSMALENDEFLATLRRYLDIAARRSVTPSFTVMTGDKDDPRFDRYYLEGNEARTFLSLFLPELPSYTALGFELRDPHETPAPNERYTKLYVFHEESGPKATHGPYRFGANIALFEQPTRIRRFAEDHPWLVDGSADFAWGLLPDPTAGNRAVAWWLTHGAARNLCAVNTSTTKERAAMLVPHAGALRGVAGRGTNATATTVPCLFSTTELTEATRGEDPDRRAEIGSKAVRIPWLAPGEARIYQIGDDA